VKNDDGKLIAFVFECVEDVKIRFTREIDQGLLNRDLYRAIEALAGREACTRIRSELERRFAMQKNASDVELAEMSAAPKKLLRAPRRQGKARRDGVLRTG